MLSRTLLALLICVCAPHAHAASLQVSPILVEIGAAETATAIMLRNSGEEAIGAQVRVMKWSQKGGADILEATRDVVASPPQVRILPNGQQTIRIIRSSRQPLGAEEGYRLLVNELPGTPKEASTSAINLLLQYSIPVFVGTPSGQRPQLSWRAFHDGENVKLTVYNSGPRREKFTSISVSGQAGQKLMDGPTLNYVLSRSTMEWSFPANSVGSSDKLSIVAQGENVGKVQLVAPVEARH